MGIRSSAVEVSEADRAQLGEVVVEPNHRSWAGGACANRIGQRSGREYPRAGRTAAGNATNGVPVATPLRQSGAGRPAQPAAGGAATADYRGQGTSGGQRDLAQTTERDPIGAPGGWPRKSAGRRLRCIASGKSRVCSRTGSRPASSAASRSSTANWPTLSGFILTHRSVRWCCAWTKSRRFRRSTAPKERCRCGPDCQPA